MKKISLALLLGVSFLGAAHHYNQQTDDYNKSFPQEPAKARRATTVAAGPFFLLWATISQKSPFCDANEPGWLKRHRETQTKMDQEKQRQNTPTNQQNHSAEQHQYRSFKGNPFKSGI